MEFERKQPVSSGCMTCERYGQTCEGADRPDECLVKITKEEAIQYEVCGGLFFWQ